MIKSKNLINLTQKLKKFFKLNINFRQKRKINKDLIMAAENGNLQLVKSLVSQDADIHADNDSALRYASYNGHLEVVKYLVEKGAEIHSLNDIALKFACENGNINVVKYLVEQGADIHAEKDYALRLAAYYGHLDVVKYLAEKGANLYADDDESLKMAANHLEVLKYFLFDCQMKIKKETKDYLQQNNHQQTLELIEKRDLLFQLDKNVIQKDSVDNLGKKVKI